MNALLNIAARILMSQIFLISGWSKIPGYAATGQYMAAHGVPGVLLPLVILLELGGGLLLLFGFLTRWVALVLAAYCLLTALLFHLQPGDQMQMINFMKNLAMAGGLLLFVRHGAGAPSVDSARADAAD
jgi:putative oxidoreductase